MPELAAWTREISVRPNPYHFLTPGPGLSQNHIFRILKNDFYTTGIFRFTVSAPRWPSEVVEQEIQLPKLVSQDLFDELSRQRTMRIGERQTKGAYLLTGLLYHRESGTAFRACTAKPGSGRYFYYMNNEWGNARRELHRAGQLSRADLTFPGCRQRSYANIPKDLIEHRVIEELAKFGRSPKLVEELIALDERERAAGRGANSDRHLRRLAELNEAQAAVERFLEAFASGVLPMDAATTCKHRQLAARVALLERETSVLRQQRSHLRSKPRRAERLRAALQDLPNTLSQASFGDQKALLRTLVDRVFMANDGSMAVDLTLA